MNNPQNNINLNSQINQNNQNNAEGNFNFQEMYIQNIDPIPNVYE